MNGSVVARGYTGAVGVESYGNGTVHIGGDVGAYSKTGNAYGVGIVGTSGYAYVGGNITVISGNTTAGAKSAGFYGNVTGDVSGHIDGSVSAMGANGTTFGVAGISTGGGDVTLYVGGDVYAKSATGGAGGAIAEGLGGTADITVGGNIVVHGYTEAIGAEVYGSGNIHIGGDVGASTAERRRLRRGDRAATGGYAYVGGNVVAISSVSRGRSRSASTATSRATSVGPHRGRRLRQVGRWRGATFGAMAGRSAPSGTVTLYVGGDIYAGSSTRLSRGRRARAGAGRQYEHHRWRQHPGRTATPTRSARKSPVRRQHPHRRQRRRLFGPATSTA